MSEEPTKTDEPGVSTPDETKIEVDRAELERLQAADKSLEELNNYAKEAGIEGAKPYMDALEEAAYAKTNNDPPAESAKPADKVPVTQDAAVMDEATKKQLELSNRNSTAAFVAAQRTEFIVKQGQLPEGKRSLFSEDEIQKMVYDPNMGSLLTRTAPKFGGNVFAAANYIMTIDKGTEVARKQGADVEVAKANAAASTDLPTAGKTAEPSTLTPVEKAEADNKKLADEIISDDPVYEMPT